MSISPPLRRWLQTSALALLTGFSSLSTELLAQVTINWSPVGNPGNPADTQVMTDRTTGYGSVPYAYNIGTYDVTISQYVAFLNSNDPTGANPLGLYSPNMSSGSLYSSVNYKSSATNGSKYSVISGRGNYPINFVDWFVALRYANWLNNGQVGGKTETGAYTLLGGFAIPTNWNTITRTPGATVFLPSENEWYKAAYYDPRSTAQGGPAADSHYWLYATSSGTAPTASAVSALVNHANYGSSVGDLTDVGAYSGTTSPWGAFDMNGEVSQLNETLWSDGASRGRRGGSFLDGSFVLRSTTRYGITPAGGDYTIGFRMASIPGSPLFADVNHDGIINGLDISLVASHWLQTGIGLAGDANGDGPVNGLDVALIASYWLETLPGSAQSASPVPEPSTIVLGILGLLVIMARRGATAKATK